MVDAIDAIEATRQPKSKLILCYFAIIGSEFKSWLLYYSLPVLEGILPLPYYSHYGLLVRSVHILSSNATNLDELERAVNWLKDFYEQYEDLYGILHILIPRLLHRLGRASCMVLCSQLVAITIKT